MSIITDIYENAQKGRETVSCITQTPDKIYSPDIDRSQLLPGELIEVSLVVKGNGYHKILDETEECHEGDLFVFDRGLPHGFFAKSEDECLTVCSVYFKAEEIFDAPFSERDSDTFCYGVFRDRRPGEYALLNSKAMEKVKNIMESIAEELEKKELGWGQSVKSYIVILMLTVSRYIRLADTVDPSRKKAHPKEWTAVSLAIREIMDNFADTSMTLDTIASKLFISRSHLSRMFRRVTGSSFTDYVRDIRLSCACRLLTTTRMSNEDIVRQCGLKDIPSFYRLFKTHTGMTPYQYRMTKHSKKGEIKMSIYNEISENLQKGKAKIVKELVAKAIEDGLPAGQILNEGLVSGMNILGEKFKNGEVYVPEVLVAARAMNAGMQLLKPILIEDGIESSGKVCIGTVQGDLHDIGKNLVKMMMEGKGLEVIDLGTDVAPETFIQTAINEGCQIICCSALLTTTMDKMAEVVKEAEAAGIRDKVKIMIGGAPITEDYCKKIGADCYTSDAASAADAAVELCKA